MLFTESDGYVKVSHYEKTHPKRTTKAIKSACKTEQRSGWIYAPEHVFTSSLNEPQGKLENVGLNNVQDG